MISPSVAPQYIEIFERQSYLAPLPEGCRILDIGANVGMASVFFGRQFPKGHIDAFECDPELYSLLVSNLKQNDVTNVVAHELAAWTHDGDLTFSPNGLGGGHLSDKGPLRVKSCDLAKWLDSRKPYDLVKMDVEGAERYLYPHVADRLGKARFLIIEYHSDADDDQFLDMILSDLRQRKFRYYLSNEDTRTVPLVNVPQRGFDNQINIFAYRS